MDILITGGAGFIGSRTAGVLVERGHRVTVLDSFSPQIHGDAPDRAESWAAAHPTVELAVGSVEDAGWLAQHTPRFDAILHLAAETGTGQSMYQVTRYNAVNVQGTANLLQALVDTPQRRTRTLVVASSRSIYGEGRYDCAAHGAVYPAGRRDDDLKAGQFEPVCPHCGGPLTLGATPEDGQLQPASVYAVTKLTQEQLTLSVGRALGLTSWALRYQNVYGAGQSLANPYTGILSIFSREMLAGRGIEIFEDGEESRDFVHVEDVARANADALEGGDGGVVNIGSGEAVAVSRIASELAARYGYAGDIRVSGRWRAGDIRHNYADLTRARQRLGFLPRVPLEDGLDSFAAWVRAAGLDPAVSGYRASLAEMETRGLMGAAR